MGGPFIGRIQGLRGIPWRSRFRRVCSQFWRRLFHLLCFILLLLIFLHQALPMYNVHICLLRHRKELIQQQHKKSICSKTIELNFCLFRAVKFCLGSSKWIVFSPSYFKISFERYSSPCLISGLLTFQTYPPAPPKK